MAEKKPGWLRTGCGCLGLLLGVVCLFLLARQARPPATTPAATGAATGPGPSPAPPYEVLRKWEVPGRGFGMEILVDPTTPKAAVLQLAEGLRERHAGRYAVIDLFDSREAWARRGDPAYPGEEFERHYLAQAGGDGWTDGAEVHWLATNRDH